MCFSFLALFFFFFFMMRSVNKSDPKNTDAIAQKKKKLKLGRYESMRRHLSSLPSLKRHHLPAPIPKTSATAAGMPGMSAAAAPPSPETRSTISADNCAIWMTDSAARVNANVTAINVANNATTNMATDTTCAANRYYGANKINSDNLSQYDLHSYCCRGRKAPTCFFFFVVSSSDYWYHCW